MILFLLSIVLLIVGYFIYGKFVEKVFGANPERLTPVKEMADGVDYVEMGSKRAFLIQFLNIAGTGPIFGAIAGAMWGPAAFLWIVFGCIFAGATHDYLVGMMSVRYKGATIAEIVGENLGGIAKWIMRIFSIILLLLVGVVFIMSPAGVLEQVFLENLGMEVNPTSIIAVIIAYYILATILPVDKVIGRIYPIFGFALLFMAVGIGFRIITGGFEIPRFEFSNMHPKDVSIFPYLFISIACGAISGFHATQSPMMARCLKNESEGRRVFYGAMIAEGIVALIWAAAAMSFFDGGLQGLADAGSAAVVVNTISNSLLGKLGGLLALIGVVAAPISSGDTAFRSARLAIADMINLKQGPIINRFLIALPLFVIGVSLTFIDFAIIWRYFAWANQTLATIALWTAAVYLLKRNRNYIIAMIPAMFMTVVVVTYIIIAPEGFGGFFGETEKHTVELIGTGIGLAVSAIVTLWFISKVRLQKDIEPITEN